MAVLDAELAGLDELEIEPPARRTRRERLWASLWPKLLAIAIALGFWQLVVWSGWRPEYVLPGPIPVFKRFFSDLPELASGAAITLRRAAWGYGIALVLGTALGALVARFAVLRAAIGSMITGLQTMPSIAWFPLAILLFRLTEGAILFVVVLGAAPSIANGMISGIDHIQPVLLRAGRVLGARGFAAFRSIILPAALPAYVAGLKQGWAFAWRSLMAGELLVLLGQTSLGQRLEYERQLSDSVGLISVMIAVLIIGIVIDGLLFASLERWVRRRYGLVDDATH